MRVRPAYGLLPLCLPLLAGCYTYEPVMSLEPAPGTRVSVLLSDEGRIEAARQIGPYAMRVDGAVVESTGTDLVLRVTDVFDVRGERNRWSGETVPLPRSYVATTSVRRFSRGRTAALVAGLATAFIAAAVKFNLLGFASGNDGGGPPPPDPSDQ